MEEVLRFDRMDINSRVVKTPEGYLMITAPIARTGVYEYVLSDGSIERDLVTEETLFDDESVNTLKLKPVTNSHPPEVLLDSKTVKHRNIGTVGETFTKTEDMLYCNMVINVDEAIEEIEKTNKRQLSPGYSCKLIKTPGTWNGQPYDVIQTKRKYNHVALCNNARGGNELTIKIDSSDSTSAIMKDELTIEDKKKLDGGQKMPTIRLDGKDYEASSEVITHIGRLDEKVEQAENKINEIKTDSQKNIDGLNNQIEEQKTTVSKLTAERDQYKEKLDAYETRDINAEIKDGIKKRLEIERIAKVVIPEAKTDELEEDELVKAIIAKHCPTAKLDDKDSVYISARLDAVIEDIEKQNVAKQNAQSSPNYSYKSDGDSAEEIRKKYIEKSKNAWRGEK